MDKINGIDMSVWQGRQDPEDGELALRWHDRVRPWQGRGEPGVVLLGFACDEGVRRNKGRVGAAGAPLAVRKLLANTAWHLGQPVYDGGDVRCEDGDLDAAHGRLAERVAEALMGLHRVCPHVRGLGSDPRADQPHGGVRPGTFDADFVAARAWVTALREGRSH